MFRKRNKERAVPYLSVREIADLKKRLGTELRAALYFFDDKTFIFCSIAGFTEIGEPTVLAADTPDETLGLTLCDKLLDFVKDMPNPPPGYANKDWAALVASRAKSARDFESKSVYVYARTVKSAIQIKAAPRISNHKELSATCSLPNGSMHIDIGAAIRRAIQASNALREAGLV